MKKRILACMFACLTLFCSCRNNIQNNGDDENTTTVTVSGNFEGGLHEVNYKPTSDYLVRNNSSDYKLLLPENPSDEILNTKEDFIDLFKEATGIKLVVQEDNGEMRYTENAKYISLGETSLAASAGVKTKDEELEYLGYSIKTVGKSIFINGNSDISVSFGVYGFLELQFNFDSFSNKYYYIDTVTESVLYDYDVREAPDLKIREEFFMMRDLTSRRRMKYVTRDEMFAGDTSVHSSMKYISPEVYNNPDDPANYHPKWFAASQLCYTAQGDEQERDLLLNTVLGIAQEYFIAEPNENIFSFGHMDIRSWCGCSTCSAMKVKYNSDAAVLIHFINDLTKRMDSWMASEAGKPYARDYQIVFLGYLKTLQPPVYYDESAEMYKPVDDSVICSPHAGVMFAPMEMCSQHSINSPCNKEYKAAFEGWKAVCSRFNFYNYCINYNHTLVFYDGFENLQEFYQFMAECNTNYLYECGPYETTMTGFKAILCYVSSKLSWNVNLDVNALIEKFCRHHFQDGGEIMLQVFKEVRALTRSNIDSMCRRNSVYMMMEDPNWWPKTLLERWVDMTNQALDKISYLKKLDPEKYEVVSMSIRRERISFEYLLVELYGNELDSAYVQKLKLQTRDDANIAGITHNGLDTTVTSIWQRWGIE